jgi:hypothetical protein
MGGIPVPIYLEDTKSTPASAQSSTNAKKKKVDISYNCVLFPHTGFVHSTNKVIIAAQSTEYNRAFISFKYLLHWLMLIDILSCVHPFVTR